MEYVTIGILYKGCIWRRRRLILTLWSVLTIIMGKKSQLHRVYLQLGTV